MEISLKIFKLHKTAIYACAHAYAHSFNHSVKCFRKYFVNKIKRSHALGAFVLTFFVFIPPSFHKCNTKFASFLLGL